MMHSRIRHRGVIAIIGILLWTFSRLLPAATAKNIILMISDGQGFNTVRATEYYNGGEAVYEGFPVRLGMTTYSASNDFTANPLGYDPARVWSKSEGYRYSNHTDSASAASAMFSGRKIEDEQINWENDSSIKTFFEAAAEHEKATGAISSVPFSHATPAAVDAHNVSRRNFSEIANEMIYQSDLDVIMGGGHPEYGHNGELLQKKNYKYVGDEATWTDLTDDRQANGFSFIDTKLEFENLASGTATYEKVIGIARVKETLQYKRVSGADPNPNVPTLRTMTEASLKVLETDPDGFALMIEGGAVDWANHGKDLERMLEEQKDFNASVEAVVNWVEGNSSWEETLLIVTADHETGDLWGVDGVFTEVGDRGPENLPAARYYSGDHTNVLVPIYAKGSGSDVFGRLVDGVDTRMVDIYGLQQKGFNGSYIDNTDVFTVMNEAASPVVPLPPALWLLGSGLLALLPFRTPAATNRE